MTDITPQGLPLAKGFLGLIERTGNKLPDSVFLFLWFTLALTVLSMVGAGLGWATINPVTGDSLKAQSLLSSENLSRLFIDMP